MKNSLRMAALTLAAVGMQQSAQAFTYNATDVFLVFHNETAKKDMLVDIGDIGHYNKKDGSQINISSYYNATDFASIGPVAQVTWGAYSFDGTSTLFSTAAPGAATARASAQGAAGAVVGGIADGSVYPVGGGATYTGTAVVTQYSTNDSSFTGALAVNGMSSSFGLAANRDVVVGAGSSAANFYQFDPQTAGNKLGTFQLDGAGAMTFQAVPEPGTYALLGLGALGMYFFRRIRK